MKPLLLTLLVLIQGIAYASDEKPEIGRYQLLYAVVPGNEGKTTYDIKTLFKIDTVTGQVWKFISGFPNTRVPDDAFVPVETKGP